MRHTDWNRLICIFLMRTHKRMPICVHGSMFCTSFQHLSVCFYCVYALAVCCLFCVVLWFFLFVRCSFVKYVRCDLLLGGMCESVFCLENVNFSTRKSTLKGNWSHFSHSVSLILDSFIAQISSTDYFSLANHIIKVSNSTLPKVRRRVYFFPAVPLSCSSVFSACSSLCRCVENDVIRFFKIINRVFSFDIKFMAHAYDFLSDLDRYLDG